MRICGVSFDHTINYGSCLQAYALQTIISSMTIDGEACEYDMLTASKIRNGKNRRRPNRGNTIKSILWYYVSKLLNHYRRTKFSFFEKKYMHYAECEERADLKKLNQQYDAFICGSDVIWNFTYTGGDSIFFLGFAEKYKFSYAASFGRAELNYADEGIMPSESAEAIYQRYIRRLDGISVREEYAKQLLKSYTDKDIEVTCDPTLLLSKDEWMNVIESKKPRGKYIFAYSTNTKSNYLRFLEKLKKQTGLPVIQITWLPIDAMRQHAFLFPTPQRWLTLLKDADYVVTSSFHGTAFSVLFQKTFFTAIEGGRDTRGNVRLYDFLSAMKLEGQIYSNTPENINLQAPDFSIANKRIAMAREKSLQYIHENLENALREKERMRICN